MKDHDSACGNHDWLACFWISSRAGVLPSHGEGAKFGDRDRFPLLQGGLEEFKKPIQHRGRVCFRDPGFLMDAMSDVLLLHWTLAHHKTRDLSVNDLLAIRRSHEYRLPFLSRMFFQLRMVVPSLFRHVATRLLSRASIASSHGVGEGSTEWCSAYIWRVYSRGQLFAFGRRPFFSISCR